MVQSKADWHPLRKRKRPPNGKGRISSNTKVRIAAGSTIKKFVRNLSFMEQPCVRVAAIVVSEIIERLSPNIAPLMTAPMHMAREIEVFSLIPTAIGASAEIVPTLVPMDMERKQPIINSPAADQLAGSSFNPKFTVCSTPPAADTAPENAPAVRKIRHMVIIFSSASPLAMTVIFSENESVRVCKNAVSRAAKKAINCRHIVKVVKYNTGTGINH